MPGRDLHQALKTENVMTKSVSGLELRLLKLQSSKTDIWYSLHARPTSYTTAGFQLTDFLNLLGFRRQPCPLHSGEAYCKLVPENFNVEEFGPAFINAFDCMQSAEKHLNICGYPLDQPEGWGFFYGKPSDRTYRPTRSSYAAGDGHTSSSREKMKTAEDDFFNFAFTFIESDYSRGWTTHYVPKHPPLSQELEAVFNLLGISRFESCPEFDFEPCHWRFTPLEQRGQSVMDNNAEYAHRCFDAHASNFSKGIEKLLAAQGEMEPFELIFLPYHRGTEERSLEDIAAQTLRPESPAQPMQDRYKYDVAISFAGTEREKAESLANGVRAAGFSVFYDGFYPEKLWGKDLVVFFDNVYRKQSRYCLIFLSQEYLNRMWTIHERQSAQARALEEKGNEYILPVQVDDVELPGMPHTVGYLSMREYEIEQIAELLIKKLSGN
jgi:hypothetical protein